MNTCAYCGREITSMDFICANCAKPQDGSESPPNLAPTQTEPEKPSATANGLSKQPKIDKPAIKDFHDSSSDEPKKSDWKNEPLHDDFKAKKITYPIIFLFFPALMVIGTILFWVIQKITSLLYILPLAFLGMIFGYFVFQSAMNLLRFSSWVFKNVEPVDVYIYLDRDPSRAEPNQIRIYDEDNMYPSLSNVGSIHILKGSCLEIGLVYTKPESLAPVKAKVGKFDSIKVIILEANGKRAWCRWREKV